MRTAHLVLILSLLLAAALPAQERRLTHRGSVRTFVVRAPQGLTRTAAPVPVVIVLHGGGGNAANAEQMSGFTRLVERERIIVVYPNGTGRRADRLLTWNAVHCCGRAMTQSVDDVGFIDAMLDTLAAHHPIDPARLYITGMSNGAMLTHRLARELRHRPAAIAPVVGALFGDEGPAAGPVSAIIFNGLRDTSVPAQGGDGDGIGQRAWDGTPPRPNLAQSAYWARTAGCEASPRMEETTQFILWTYACPAGYDVRLYQVKNSGHAWPGGQRGSRVGDRPTAAVDATELMWAFFEGHPRP